MDKNLKSYCIDESALHEWLPWGGLIHPAVIRNKDDSYMGVFSCLENVETLNKVIEKIELVNGWVIWMEYQHFNDNPKQYLVVLWNPLLDEEYAINTLIDKKIHLNKFKDYFYAQLLEIKRIVSKSVNVSLVENEELLSFLSSTLSMENKKIQMPEIPLYLDVILSNLKFKMLKNSIIVNDFNMTIITLPNLTSYRQFIIDTLFDQLKGYKYRFFGRLLVFSKSEAQKEIKRYMKNWCLNRKIVKSALERNILNNINGYYTNSFIFYHKDNIALKDEIEKIELILETIGIPYVVETENYKDAWWGSLPGIFRANLTMPIQGLESVNDMFLGIEKGRKKSVQA